MKGRLVALGASFTLAAAACGGGTPVPAKTSASGRALLPDVRLARDRPPVVLVARDGDPAGAVAAAVTTVGLGEGGVDDPEMSVALAGVVESRLLARGLVPTVVPSGSGLRALLLGTTPAEAENAAAALRDALSQPVTAGDLAAAKKKLGSLAARPLADPSLARWARCTGSPYARSARAGTSGDDLDLARLERWRAAATSLPRVAFAVVAPRRTAEAVAGAVAQLPAWRTGAALPGATLTAGTDVDVYESSEALPTTGSAPVLHVTLDVPTATAAVTTAEALGDPHGPLASRLAALELPFRMKQVIGTADPRGGCIGIELAAATTASGALVPAILATRVADAIALVQVEARVHLAEGERLDGRTLARRAGDAREAADRAAWWALADAAVRDHDSQAPALLHTSFALGLPLRRGAPASSDTALQPARDTLAAALAKAALSWEKPACEGRARVEPGQGETWVLLASPCGTDAETDQDAGLTALFASASAELARTSPEVRVEPWITADGAGLLAHGPALAGESPAAHARRLADVVARSFAAEALPLPALGRARAERLRHDAASDGPAFGILAGALAPGHPSWVLPTGRDDVLARASDAAILARAEALRAGPLRVAVLANGDAAQGEAALRAVDRWIDRRGGEARACRPATAALPPRPGTYGLEPRAGSLAAEAYLAFPLAPGDVAERDHATFVAAALDGDGGLLDRALRGPALARSWSAHVIGAPRAPALAIRLVAPQTSLDGAVMQTRALVDRLWKGGFTAADLERGTRIAARDAVATALDPRARVVATWRGETLPTSAQPFPRGAPSLDELRAFAARRLGEESLVVVAARPPLVKTPPPDPAPPAANAAPKAP